jgi:hypothetical protein
MLGEATQCTQRTDAVRDAQEVTFFLQLQPELEKSSAIMPHTTINNRQGCVETNTETQLEEVSRRSDLLELSH